MERQLSEGKGLKGYHGNSCFSFSLLIHLVPNILTNHLDKEVFKHMLNDALRDKKLSLLGAQVNCIPKAGNVLDPLLGLKCSQHWKCSQLHCLSSEHSWFAQVTHTEHSFVPKHSFLQHAFQTKIHLQYLKEILDL